MFFSSAGCKGVGGNSIMDFETLCAKMGYNPLKEPYPYPINSHEDDSQPNPASVLTLEELDFMCQYLIEHRDEIVL